MTPATLARRYAAGPLVAYHEAGHALMAHLRGRRVERVHVGHARDSGATSLAASIYDPLDRALVLAGGERAERRSVSWLPEFERLTGRSDDRQHLALALEELPDWTLAALVERVDAMLRDEWAALDRLAKRLDDVRVLSGDEVAAILGGR